MIIIIIINYCRDDDAFRTRVRYDIIIIGIRDVVGVLSCCDGRRSVPCSERVFGIPTFIIVYYRDRGCGRLTTTTDEILCQIYFRHSAVGDNDIIMIKTLLRVERGYATLVDKNDDDNNLSVWSSWEYYNNNNNVDTRKAKKMCTIRLFAIFYYYNNMHNLLLTFVTTNVMNTMQYRHHRYRMVVVVDAQRTDNGRDTCVRKNDISFYSRNTRRISRRLKT